MQTRTLIVALALTLLAGNASLLKAEKLQALILDGRNNHDWQATTPILTQILEETKMFVVDVATAPPRGQDISGFKPNFAAYDVVVSNYNDDTLWSEETRQEFVDFVHGGGGFVVIHAANNAFTNWKEYNDMIGLGWRGPGFGNWVTFNDEGQQVRMPKGEGPGAGHGPQHAFTIVVRDRKHPVTEGMPSSWFHAKDELYHGQRGPAANMQILATAFSANDKRGTGVHEPMIWVIPYGKGRVFTTVMGHAPYSMTCAGFVATVQRGAEWAATGEVAQQLPQDFPGTDEVRVREFRQ